MEEVNKGCLMTRMGVSGRMFLLVPTHLGWLVGVEFNAPLDTI